MKRMVLAVSATLLALGAWGVTEPDARVATPSSLTAPTMPDELVDVRDARRQSTTARDRLEASMQTLIGDALRARWGFGHRFELVEIESLALGDQHARTRVWGFWIAQGVTPTMLRADLLIDRHDHAVSRIHVQAYTSDGLDLTRTARFADSHREHAATSARPSTIGPP